MASGFTFGAVAPQPQQQPQSTSLFGSGSAPIATATPSFGAPVSSTGTQSLFGTNPLNTSTVPTGFSFSSPAPAQRQQQPTGFTLGGGLAAPTTSAPGTGFSFGGAPSTAATAAPTLPTATATGTTAFGGLGGIPSTGGQRISSLAVGVDPATGWPARTENRAIQELPVPPEIIAAVEDLKNHMKAQKSVLAELSRTSDFDIDSVSEQIEDVRIGVVSLLNTMHKQEIASASIIKDIHELGKDIDLISQAQDVSTYGFGGPQLMLVFLYQLLETYNKRMTGYRTEIERAEYSLQTIFGAANTNAKDLWDTLTATKDSVLFFAAQIQELHEELRNALSVHKNVSQVLYGNPPQPWLTSALSGNLDFGNVISPLEKAFSNPCPSKRTASAANLENVVKRTYSMFSRTPSGLDSRAMPSSSSEALLGTPSRDLRSSGGVGLSYSPSYHPSMMGSYMGPTSPAPNASLKRSKK